MVCAKSDFISFSGIEIGNYIRLPIVRTAIMLCEGKGVCPCAASQRIPICTTDNEVVAEAAIDCVVACQTGEAIVGAKSVVCMFRDVSTKQKIGNLIVHPVVGCRSNCAVDRLSMHNR